MLSLYICKPHQDKERILLLEGLQFLKTDCLGMVTSRCYNLFNKISKYYTSEDDAKDGKNPFKSENELLISKTLFRNSEIKGLVYDDWELFQNKDLFNKFIDNISSSYEVYNEPKRDKLRINAQTIYLQASIKKLQKLLNILERFNEIDENHLVLRSERLISIQHEANRNELSDIINIICARFSEDPKDWKRHLTQLNKYKSMVEQELKDHEELHYELSNNLSNKDNPSLKYYFVLKSINPDNKDDDYCDITDFINKITSNNQEGKTSYDTLIEYAQKILSYNLATTKLNKGEDDHDLKVEINRQKSLFIQEKSIPDFVLDLICDDSFKSKVDYDIVSNSANDLLEELKDKQGNHDIDPGPNNKGVISPSCESFVKNRCPQCCVIS